MAATTATQPTSTKRLTKTQRFGRKPERVAFKRDQTQRMMADLERLSNELVIDPEKLAEFVRRWQGGFRDYSFHNTMLIWSQNPEASLCAGYGDWESKHNRHVLKGARGLAILAPIFRKLTAKDGEPVKGADGKVKRETFAHIFRVVYVWDVSQTEGEPVKLAGEQYTSGKSSLTLEQIITAFPEYETIINGQSATGGATDGKRIHLAKGSAVQMIATYAHELGHNEAGHTATKKTERVQELNRNTMELEAEAISYLVSCYLGIKNDKSKHYIAHWQGDAEKLGKVGQGDYVQCLQDNQTAASNQLAV